MGDSRLSLFLMTAIIRQKLSCSHGGWQISLANSGHLLLLALGVLASLDIRIERGAVCGAAARTGKPAVGGEVDIHVELAGCDIEVAAGFRLGWHDAQSHF